ncbi:hypothetical protein [Oricola indica]|uniref:hypothetical protein n=1 Tax=Oricola indica TaxID=2872591 RepID=UPI001CBFE636|nr:hypothetical protein [Oricola indica]
MSDWYLISFIMLFSFSIYRYGLFSYPTFFISQITLYLVLMPWALEGVDEISGAHSSVTWRFPIAVLLYTVFYLMGMRASAPLAFRRDTFFKSRFRRLEVERPGSRVAYVGLIVIAAGMIAYSLLSRNIFTSGPFLLTIIGFDLALALYLFGRSRRPSWLNAMWFVGLLILFVYAGFRYRIMILFFAEVMPFAVGRSKIFSRLALIVGTFLLAIILGAFGQIRSYGSFSNIDLLDAELDLRTAFLASGEQTVTISTIAVVEHHDILEKVGFEPIILVATQFIPSSIFPSKPRATYLGAYNKVTTGLRNTGTAMHDVGQATLMFGIVGLPFSALLLGFILGYLLNATLKRSPNINYTIAVVVLFAVSLPTRGYFAQQVTWALTFLLPLVILQLNGGRGARPPMSWRYETLSKSLHFQGRVWSKILGPVALR